MPNVNVALIGQKQAIRKSLFERLKNIQSSIFAEYYPASVTICDTELYHLYINDATIVTKYTMHSLKA